MGEKTKGCQARQGLQRICEKAGWEREIGAGALGQGGLLTMLAEGSPRVQTGFHGLQGSRREREAEPEKCLDLRPQESGARQHPGSPGNTQNGFL